jgi:hypothetical protein
MVRYPAGSPSKARARVIRSTAVESRRNRTFLSMGDKLSLDFGSSNATAGGKPAHNRAARTWTDACDDSNGTIHVCIPSNGLFPILHSKKTLIKS